MRSLSRPHLTTADLSRVGVNLSVPLLILTPCFLALGLRLVVVHVAVPLSPASHTGRLSGRQSWCFACYPIDADVRSGVAMQSPLLWALYLVLSMA